MGELQDLDDEIWKEITELGEGFQASNKGRIRYMEILKPKDNGKGYKFINKKYKRQYIHRCVMKVFHPIENSHNLQVNHIDYDPSNNNLENLEWCTPQENTDHKIANTERYNKHRENLSRIGKEKVKNGTSAILHLTEEQKRKSWITRSKNYTPDKHRYFGKFGDNSPKHLFSNEQVREIREKHISEKLTGYKLAKEYNVSTTVMYDILKGKSYKDA